MSNEQWLIVLFVAFMKIFIFGIPLFFVFREERQLKKEIESLEDDDGIRENML